MNRLPTIISTSARSPRLLHTTTMGSSSRVQLVSPQEVQAQGLGKYRVLDSSFHLPNSGRSALDDFRRGPRLPGARLFDHDLVADRSYTLPNSPVKLGHMLPDIHTFKLHAQLLGIARNDHLLLYDSLGLFSAPRAAWLFNVSTHPPFFTSRPHNTMTLCLLVAIRPMAIPTSRSWMAGCPVGFMRSVPSKPGPPAPHPSLLSMSFQDFPRLMRERKWFRTTPSSKTLPRLLLKTNL